MPLHPAYATTDATARVITAADCLCLTLDQFKRRQNQAPVAMRAEEYLRICFGERGLPTSNIHAWLRRGDAVIAGSTI